jgi:hypothetical protein
LVYRRFRKRRVSATAATASGKDDDFCGSTMDNGPSCEDSDFQVTIINDSSDNRQLSRQFGSSTAPAMNHTINNRTSNLMLFDLPLDDDYPPAKYTFDLSDTFKQNIMGTYAPTTMQVVAPYPMLEDTSCDSEVDSWAQTDGTVGSLEDRLEEITAEI